MARCKGCHKFVKEDPKDPKVTAEIKVLLDLLQNYAFDDFGGDVIPHAIGSHAVYGYDFDDYWEDIGTIRSFYETNIALARPNPPFNMFDPRYPIYSHPRYLPGSTLADSVLHNVLLADGCRIEHAEIRDSVIGLRSQICGGVRICDSILMGNDYYESPDTVRSTGVPMGIGEGSRIEGAIIDKNARIGENVTVLPFPRGVDIDTDNWVVRDGIVVVPKDGVLIPGTVISPETIKVS
jgi:glucose-1-phosphate adenylyltransferase